MNRWMTTEVLNLFIKNIECSGLRIKRFNFLFYLSKMERHPATSPKIHSLTLVKTIFQNGEHKIRWNKIKCQRLIFPFICYLFFIRPSTRAQRNREIRRKKKDKENKMLTVPCLFLGRNELSVVWPKPYTSCSRT